LAPGRRPPAGGKSVAAGGSPGRAEAARPRARPGCLSI